MKNEDLYNSSNEATYCPEDNKLRLYVGRVPRDEYLALKKERWTSTPKQDCDFVAKWSIDRENTALSYADDIGDEDQSPTDRAADRAERFAGYREKRRAEAHGYADTFESQPIVHGHQSEQRAARAAARHGRIGNYACNQWAKSEYWQSRTAGVISHALYRSRPSVRMGRIKEIEKDLRAHRKHIAEHNDLIKMWEKIETLPKNYQDMLVGNWGYYTHPVTGEELQMYQLREHGEHPLSIEQCKELYLSSHKPITEKTRFENHCELRLSYENMMLDAVGGMAGELTIEKGGFFAGIIISKVNKSSVTGRVTSVQCIDTVPERSFLWRDRKPPEHGFYYWNFDTEKSVSGSYVAPTEESKAELKRILSKIKAATPKTETIPLINPSPVFAHQLQKIFNDEYLGSTYCSDTRKEEIRNTKPVEMVQAKYSANSKGSWSNCEAISVDKYGKKVYTSYNGKYNVAFKIRVWNRGTGVGPRVIMLTDKPGKSFRLQYKEVTA